MSLWAASQFPQFVNLLLTRFLGCHSPQVKGVIIENTFTSLPNLAPRVIPQLPRVLCNLLMSDRWDAAKTMPHIPPTTPMLFLSGLSDRLVPPSEMRDLFNARGEGKARWADFATGEHNDTCLLPEYWVVIDEWLKSEIDH